jgi:lipoprotein-anchoring transpeptidase ErfK/SrfK
MGSRRSWVALLGVTTAAVVGAGAYAFGPERTGAPPARPVAVAGTTGAGAPPGPTSPPSRAPAEASTRASADPSVAQFQRRYGIVPVTGTVDALTADVTRRLTASGTAAERALCGAPATGLTACVDLTLQTMWVVRDGTVVFGPTVVRTGMPGGYQTPPGTFRVGWRSPRAWSHPYRVWLPYWQDFNAGIGFHETTTYLHDATLGSHGCVNLLHDDAVALWGTTSTGTLVRVFGRRPGT